MELNETSVPELTASLMSGSPHDLASGVRPILVVGPSLGTSVSALWQPALDQLADDFTVIGWDLPGHGNSRASSAPFTIEQLADAVEALIAAQTAENATPDDHPMYCAGVSLSGAVSLELARRAESRFSAHAVICSAAKIGQPEGWTERADLVATAGTPTMVEGSAQRWFAPGFIDKHPDVATTLLDSLQHADRHSYAHACRALSQFDLREQLGTITIPVLAVAGEQDAVCPPAEAHFIAEHAPNAHAQVLSDVAHLAPAEDPENTAGLLKEHFLG